MVFEEIDDAALLIEFRNERNWYASNIGHIEVQNRRARGICVDPGLRLRCHEQVQQEPAVYALIIGTK